MTNQSLGDAILSHDKYFHQVISMIPPELYHPPSIDPVVANSKFYKHRRLPLEPNERKLISKQKKLKKYNPDYQEPEEDDSEDDDEDRDDKHDDEGDMDADDKEGRDEKIIASSESKLYKPVKPNKNINKSSVDDLRERLQSRISDLKGNRDSKKPAFDVKAKQPAKNKTPNQPTKDQHHSKPSSNNNIKAQDANSNNHKKRNIDDVREQLMQIDEHVPVAVDSNHADHDDDIDMEFALGDGHHHNARKAKDLGKPGSKMKRLQRMAEEVEKKRQRLESYKSQGEAGKEMLDKERWNDVLASASGDRAVIDGNKVKKAMKRMEKSKAKSSREWQARIQEVSSTKQAKIDKREQNIQNKKQGIKTPGQSSSSTSSTHTSSGGAGGNRAGFEGKKTEFLNRGNSKSPSRQQNGKDNKRTEG